MLNGCFPRQLQRLFKIKLLNEDGAFIEDWIALGFTTIRENSGNLDLVLKYVQARNPQAAVDFQVFIVGYIIASVNVIPENDTQSKTGDGRNEQ